MGKRKINKKINLFIAGGLLTKRTILCPLSLFIIGISGGLNKIIESLSPLI